jgi:hypothetical protein
MGDLEQQRIDYIEKRLQAYDQRFCVVDGKLEAMSLGFVKFETKQEQIITAIEKLQKAVEEINLKPIKNYQTAVTAIITGVISIAITAVSVYLGFKGK